MTTNNDLIIMLCESWLACVSDDNQADETILGLADQVLALLNEHKMH